MTLRVYYEDTDIGGVVYHANYLKFCERARSELFFAKGGTPRFEGGHFVVRRLEADYLKPAYLGDLLKVTVELESLQGATLLMRQRVFRADEPLFEMRVKLVYLLQDGRIGRLDAAKKAKLLSFLEE